MDLWIRVTILPIWETSVSDTREARERGKLRLECVKLAKEFEAKIKEAIRERACNT